ncbi:MAG: DUF1127 domain-containing protein [Paracoccaceae bacterium]|nr:DUF1127 domain-containing protein [Paracoccaceae bacterium]MDG2258934.1 DUF1127 domain-containing protein [Paracoccaceae bacterium]
MAAFDIYRANTLTAAKSGLSFNVLSMAIASFVAWNDERVTRKTLNSLTNRELEDIGLVRGDIDGIARQSTH